MRILVINGSPHPKGVIANLLKAVTEGLSQNADIEWIDAGKLNIRPCLGCMKCRRDPNGICVLPADDGHVMGQKLRQADGLIIGTPTYWGNMSAQLKLIFDRNVPALMGEKPSGTPIPKHKGKPAVVVTACTTPWPFNWIFAESRGALAAVHEVLKWSGFKTIGRLAQPGTKNRPGASEKHLAKARRMGEKLNRF